MKKHLYFNLILIVIFEFYACSGNGKSNTADSTANASKKQPLDTADTRLANNLSNFCNNQINAAQLAEKQASTQKVKAFAKQNEQLYTELSNHLNHISEEYSIKLPAEASVVSKENLQNLKAVKGASFDHAYLLKILKLHNAMIREYNAAKNIQCVPLKMFVGSNQAAIIKQAYTISDLKDQTP